MENIRERIGFFQKQILGWHFEENERHHPWSEEKNAYKIWLSEIIMQQTRIEQGLPYYLRFVEKYPSIEALAAAPDEEVFLLWQGLGYYSRCRNILHTARYIVREYKGEFPSDYKEIIKLKGVGSYTAAAIASFAFDLPYAVLDGNVFRLLARFQGAEIPIDSSTGKKFFQKTAQEFLPMENPAAYNQAVMDFGATVCTPQHPKCEICPLASRCRAFADHLVEILPIKEKRIHVKERYFHYLILHFQGKIYLQQRQKKDIWQHLFEPFLIESENLPTQHPSWLALESVVNHVDWDVFQTNQRLTHQLIKSRFHHVYLETVPSLLQSGYWLNQEEINGFAFPKTVLLFLRQLSLVSFQERN